MRTRLGVLAFGGLVLACAVLIDAHFFSLWADPLPLALAIMPGVIPMRGVSASILDRGTQDYNASARKLVWELDDGYPTSDILLTIEGTIVVTHVGTDITAILDDHIQRLVRAVRLESGPKNNPIIEDVALRDLHVAWLNHVNGTEVQVPVSDVVAGTYAFRLHTGFTFSPWWLNRGVGRMESFLPARPTQGLRLTLTLNVDTHITGSGAGTGAIYTGGQDTSAFTVGPSFSVQQVIHPHLDKLPVTVPHYRSFTIGDPFTAAATDREMKLQRDRLAHFHIIRQTYDSTLEKLENSITNLALRSTRKDILEKVSAKALRALAQRRTPVSLPTTGYLFLLFSQDGMLGSALDTTRYPSLRYVADLAAPTSGTSKLTITAMEPVPLSELR